MMSRKMEISRRSPILITLLGIVIAVALLPGADPAHATTPGRNGRLAFAAETATSSQIYSIRPDGTGLQQLTNVNGFAGSPDWSPDGQRIAFEVDDDTHAGIAVMNADGSNLRDLTPTGLQSQPAFTPDGHHLVYECADCPGGDGIFLMRDDASDRPGIRLSTNPFTDGWDANPEVSPDGKTVTFVRHQVPGLLQALFAVDIHGDDKPQGQADTSTEGIKVRHERQITSYELEVGIKHDWSPDGKHIVLTAHADFPNGFSPNVATIKPNGNGLRMLTNYSGNSTAALAGSYSPDGRWIAFRLENAGLLQLWVISPDGENRRLLGTFPFAPRFIDWGTNTD